MLKNIFKKKSGGRGEGKEGPTPLKKINKKVDKKKGKGSTDKEGSNKRI
jgi:hypothetical protein